MKYGHENTRGNICPESGNYGKRLDDGFIEEIRIVRCQLEINRLADAALERFRENVFGNSGAEHGGQHFMFLEQLRTFEIPAVVFQTIAIVLLIENKGAVKFVFENFNIPLNSFGGTGKITVLRDIRFAEFCGKVFAVWVAIFFQLRNKSYQAVKLLLIYRHFTPLKLYDLTYNRKTLNYNLKIAFYFLYCILTIIMNEEDCHAGIFKNEPKV